MKIINKRLTQLGNASSRQLCGSSKEQIERSVCASRCWSRQRSIQDICPLRSAFVEAGRRSGGAEGRASEI